MDIDLGRVCLLATHQDDEAISSGGLLNELCIVDKLNAENILIYYFNGSDHPGLSKEERIAYGEENKELLKYLGCKSFVSKYCKMNLLETVPITDHISEIESVINEFKPATMIIPQISYNQDHRRIFEAAITSTRNHFRNHYVKNILAGEEIETIQTNRGQEIMAPSFFIPIDIKEKIKLYQFYQTQQRSHRSIEAIKALARLRGAQCNSPTGYAEAFVVIRATVGAFI